jgi:hypothetical protein
VAAEHSRPNDGHALADGGPQVAQDGTRQVSDWIEPLLASAIYWYGGWVFLTGALAERAQLKVSS